MLTYALFVFTVSIHRKNLVFIYIISSLVITLGTVPFYIGIQLLNNNYVAEHYQLDKLLGPTLLNVPIEDFAWYLFINVLLALSYHYIFDSEFEKKKITAKQIWESIKKFFSLKQIR